ncbi:9-O-acetylesterase [Sphingomonas sp. IC-56]|uniref:sialate O-acetylesterase n=1 Tax=Sphingomonas sp. IC-56 TaxID=2898529 RepID=UPI001E55BD9C|nr:sialate O-acetylesterase [Sphingomonas sp. IC-56]MCD2324393.1 9-O-acetylesterase [Sphingomonas sp. IC-56]
MLNRTTALTALLAGLFTASGAYARPRLDGAIGDHAILQRNQPITLAGSASPGETVMISLAGRSVSIAADRDGRFKAQLPALPAGGPYTLTLAAPSGATILNDILIGDVFLCSGQSNMEMKVREAQSLFPEAHPPLDTRLRLLTVAKKTAVTPASKFDTVPAWEIASPEAAYNFSAACLYMVQSLRRDTDVPVGAIHSSWGGSRISAWMSDAALRKGGLGDQADLLALYARDPVAATRRTSSIWEGWWRAGSGDAAGKEPWQPGAALEWRPVPAFTNFESWGVPELADYNGMLWYQRTVELTDAQARGAATLSLGMIDDADRTWVNGMGVGGTSLAGAPRVYVLPAGTLKPGRNVITVNDDDVYAFGGMLGPVEAMRLTFADGTSVPLSTDWRYAIAKRVAGSAPRVPWDDINGAGTLFNAMIAPLGPIRLAGFAWYQGESDTGIPGYDRRLRALIEDWRTRFGTPTTAFAIAQLANYGGPATAPSESGWGDVRDAQRRVAATDPHVGLAVTLDIGDAQDIHPGEKRLVGQRLAQAMRAAIAGTPGGRAGPAIASAERQGTNIVLHFSGVKGALRTTSSDQAIGFELCGSAPGSCRYAAARAAGSDVTVTGDGKPVTRVRYAWADAPATNLWDEAHLPVGTFEIAVP